jgi:hypothetical protein
MDLNRAAGTRTTSFGSTKDCLNFEKVDSTLQDDSKYSRSSTLGQSVRCQSRGSNEDSAAKIFQDLTFGRRTARGENTAASLISQPILTAVEGLNYQEAEQVYRSRESLGRSADRGLMLPTKFSRGKSSKSLTLQHLYGWILYS